MARFAQKAVKDVDKGWNAFVSNMQFLNSLDVYIGIHEGVGHDGTSLSAAQIGAIHEFGSKDGRIPQRRWLRAGIDYYSREILDGYEKVFNSAFKKGTNVRTGLNRLGSFGVAKIKEYIRKVGPSVWPDITDETKLRKKSTKILIGKTSQLINGITYTLRPAGIKLGEGTRLSDADGSTVVSTVARPKRTVAKIRSERRKSALSKRKERKSATKVRRKEERTQKRATSKLRKKERRAQSRASKRDSLKRRRFMSKLRMDSKKDATKQRNKESRKVRRDELRQRKKVRKSTARIKTRLKKQASSKRMSVQKKATKQRSKDSRRKRLLISKLRRTDRADKSKTKKAAANKARKDRAKAKPLTKPERLRRVQEAFSGR